jgi:signal transduction histidine kinase
MSNETPQTMPAVFRQRTIFGLRKRARSLTTRLIIVQILVAALASGIAGAIISFGFSNSSRALTPDDFLVYALVPAMGWYFGFPDGMSNGIGNNPISSTSPDGYSLLIDTDGQTILFSQGDTACRQGARVGQCAPELVGQLTQNYAYTRGGQRWLQITRTTRTGQIAFARRAAVLEPCLIDDLACTTPSFVLGFTAIMSLFAVPPALILAYLTARPLARRMQRIAQTSRAFAAADFSARVNDQQQDEVGQLAQEFDRMAAAMQQNIVTLRDLAQRNADLMQQAEQLATENERARISRELHDAITQSLFSLSISAAKLPDLIREEPQKGIERAQMIASLSETVLVDLRTLLVDLRSTAVSQQGLCEAILLLCEQWGALHKIAIAPRLALSGRALSASIEDAVYRVIQEALSNITKHARATQATITLIQGQQEIILTIHDNGIGFVTAPESARAGQFGLFTMRERIRALGGSFSIDSAPGAGTTIRASVPMVVTSAD